MVRLRLKGDLVHFRSASVARTRRNDSKTMRQTTTCCWVYCDC